MCRCCACVHTQCHTPALPTLVLPTASSSLLLKPVTFLPLIKGEPSGPLASTRPAGPWHTADMILPAGQPPAAAAATARDPAQQLFKQYSGNNHALCFLQGTCLHILALTRLLCVGGGLAAGLPVAALWRSQSPSSLAHARTPTTPDVYHQPTSFAYACCMPGWLTVAAQGVCTRTCCCCL